MRKIRIFGELGKKFGENYFLNVENPAEALRALVSQIPGFEKFVIESEKAGAGYVVKVNDLELCDKKEFFMTGKGEISIVPVIVGSGGEFRILVGAALIAASFFVGPAGPYFMNAGIAMAIGGTAEILTRGMIPSGSPHEKPDNKPSYSFTGPVNTNAQGQPVPICYGIMKVGGSTISASIQTENLMAGYEYADVEDSVIRWAIYTDSHFAYVPLPNNWTRKVLLSFVPKNPSSEYYADSWQYQVFYNKKVLVLRSL